MRSKPKLENLRKKSRFSGLKEVQVGDVRSNVIEYLYTKLIEIKRILGKKINDIFTFPAL